MAINTFATILFGVFIIFMAINFSIAGKKTSSLV